MNFGRILEQAKELWARPAGKWIFGGAAAFLVLAGLVSFLLTRPQFSDLGTFAAADAPKVAQKLDGSKIAYRSGTADYSFQVRQGDLSKAKLLLAEINLDPTSTSWAGADMWKDRVSWTNTEFDKRQLWKEQKEADLTHAIESLDVVDKARVMISVPVKEALFKADEKPPKATVVILPAKGQRLAVPVVEAIMKTIAGAVEGLEPTAVEVIDSSTSRVVSDTAFKKQTGTNGVSELDGDHLAILRQVQESWQQVLTEKLEQVVGPRNVSVIVNPVINWERATTEALEYKGGGPNGQGYVLSEQLTDKSSTGQQAANGGLPGAGTLPNTQVGVPTYPVINGGQGGNLTQDESNRIINYLVNQTKTMTERPGGAIEEMAVGIFINRDKIEPDMEQAVKNVVATAIGSKAKVEVAAMTFAPSVFDQLVKEQKPTEPVGSLNWLVLVLVAALTLGAIGFFFVAIKPRRPVLEPIFAGPEAAMMGGIPVSEFEMAAASDPPSGEGAPRDKRLPQTPEELAHMQPEEIALLGDEFLDKLGMDPVKARMRERVEKIAKSSPETVANLIKTWISGG